MHVPVVVLKSNRVTRLATVYGYIKTPNGDTVVVLINEDTTIVDVNVFVVATKAKYVPISVFVNRVVVAPRRKITAVT